ncbi:hypothetical protein, partial [Paraburkholderia azotifigens]
NLSQDQTLQFKPVTVVRALSNPVAHSKSLTDDSTEPLGSIKPSSISFCVRLDYFRYLSNPKIAVRRHRAPTLIGC